MPIQSEQSFYRANGSLSKSYMQVGEIVEIHVPYWGARLCNLSNNHE